MIYRDIFEESIIGKITQGCIFNGAKSRFYQDDCDVYGIIISPRCDIEQRKAPLYYFLPVIKLDDWLHVDFPPIYVSALEKDVKNVLKNQLKSVGESDSIIEKFKPDDVERILKKHQAKLKKNIEEKIEIWKTIETYKLGNMPLTSITSRDASNIQKNLFEELISHKNPNFYFIESEKEKGYVIRMREISRLSPNVMFRLANGIDTKLADEELADNDLKQLEDNDIYMPLFVVKSPYMEHIMQHFLQQFNKIGIEDISKEFTGIFTELIK